MTDNERRAHYVERITRYYLAKKAYPAIDHGPEPTPADFGLPNDDWACGQQHKMVLREQARTV